MAKSCKAESSGIVEFAATLSTKNLKLTGFATHMLQNGADFVTIAECLGHALLSNTQKYTHLAKVDIIDAYNVAHRRGVGNEGEGPGSRSA